MQFKSWFDSNREFPLPDRDFCACFTGHRAARLPWGYNESDFRCIKLKTELRKEIEILYDQGVRWFISGMADGIDTYAAEIVLNAKTVCPEIGLICVFPYGKGDNRRALWIAERADRVVSLYRSYSVGCMAGRNRFLVENSRHIVCAFSGDANSGTARTMRMAKEKGLSLSIIAI